MRLVALTLAALLLLVFAGAAGTQTTGRISVTATTADARVLGYQRAHVMRLWNRSVSSTPIGHAVIVCTLLGVGGVLGGGISDCKATYVLPLGQIVAAGVRHSARHYTLVITGGTGRYLGAVGKVDRRPADVPGQARYIFRLG